MIPKLIHYCWFGGAKKPKETLKFISGWKTILPDYQIIEWSEKNFDVSVAPDYVREAYKAKKYAFVSDYVRLWALYENGGIYLDTDVEVLRPIDEYIFDKNLVLGFECSGLFMTAFIACSKHNEFIKEFMNQYDKRKFIKNDGSYDLTPNTEYLSALVQRKGFDIYLNETQMIGNTIVYPQDYFCGYDMENSHANITENTVMIHHFQSSWKKMAILDWIKYKLIVRMMQMLLGYERYDKLKSRLKRKNEKKK